ncbi:ABC transporter ATP-binding protein [Sphingomonas sp. Leaf412]|uniref:ABC transporter ATP-binding protein n=1 Tax=Sphingomonas sp. Leaf412 TaxID=1736370 RepID=UPI00138F1FF8|nr:ABC transporter ATP-binding protein [Sphingomonas sp. Leaf412]
MPIARPFVWTVPIVAVLGVIASLLEGVGIGLLVPFIYLTLSKTLPDTAPALVRPIVELVRSFEPDRRLAFVAAGILLMVSLKAAVGIANATLVAAIEGRVGARIRAALSARLLGAGYPFFVGNDAAHLVNVVATDAWRASDGVRLIFALATSAAAIVIFGTLLFLMEWRLTLIVAAGVTIIRACYVAYGRRLRRKSERVSTSNRALGKQMLTMVTAIRMIFVFAQEKREHERFVDASEEVRRAMFDIERATLVVGPIFELALATLFVVVLMVSTRLAIDLPIAATFLVLLYRLQPHLMTINQSRIGLAAIRGATREVEWLLAQAGPADREGGGPVPDLRTADIVFADVTYRFPGNERDHAALQGASFTIRAGETTALIGRSGAGKTTIVNLLCRLLDPTTGTIRVGDAPLSAIDLDRWRRGIALAGQDIDLIDGTIRDNIAYGTQDASDDAVMEAARLADADDFVRALPFGLDTHVGMRGLSLSGGQRQRIGLARALLRRPTLLILDEATNAVDGLSEATIMRLLREHRSFHTAIVISHRRSTLAACQSGVVLSDGRVVEAGKLGALQFVRTMEAEFAVEAGA